MKLVNFLISQLLPPINYFYFIIGNLHVAIQPNMTAQNNLVVLLVKLKVIPLSQIIQMYSSTPIQPPKRVKWVKVISKVCNGNLLYSV